MRIVVVAIIILFISCSVATASTSISRLRFSSRQIDFLGVGGGEDKKRPDQWDPCIFFLAVRWSARWRRYPTRTLRANALFVLSFSFRVGCGVWNLVSEKGDTYAKGGMGNCCYTSERLRQFTRRCSQDAVVPLSRPCSHNSSDAFDEAVPVVVYVPSTLQHWMS